MALNGWCWCVGDARGTYLSTETRREALEEALEQAGDRKHLSIHIGRCDPLSHRDFTYCHGRVLLEAVAKDAEELCGASICEGTKDYPFACGGVEMSADAEEELDHILSDVLTTWLDKHLPRCPFFEVVDISTFSVAAAHAALAEEEQNDRFLGKP